MKFDRVVNAFSIKILGEITGVIFLTNKYRFKNSKNIFAKIKIKENKFIFFIY